jgi:hypothetical protein
VVFRQPEIGMPESFHPTRKRRLLEPAFSGGEKDLVNPPAGKKLTSHPGVHLIVAPDVKMGKNEPKTLSKVHHSPSKAPKGLIRSPGHVSV